MERIKTIYRENIFVKWNLENSKKYMISFYIEVNEQEKEIQVQIEDDYEYKELYQNYDEVFNTYKGYKEQKELYDIITKHINSIDELPWYSIFNIWLYQPIKTIYCWY